MATKRAQVHAARHAIFVVMSAERIRVRMLYYLVISFPPAATVSAKETGYSI